jgi:hypothetical protein
MATATITHPAALPPNLPADPWNTGGELGTVGAVGTGTGVFTAEIDMGPGTGT